MTRNLLLVLTAQWLSALSDSALLIVSIARLAEMQGPAWMVPILKFSAVICFVLLAPCAGAVADRWPKERLMVLSNALKLAAVCCLALGLTPAIVMLWVGFAAALYAPAKYGMLTEIVRGEKLVWANGYLEGVTVAGIILGTALGGLLLNVDLLPAGWLEAAASMGLTPSTLWLAMGFLVILNAAALFLCLWIRPSGVVYLRHVLEVMPLLANFRSDNLRLLNDPIGRVALFATTSLLAAGAVFQLLVLQWLQHSFGLDLGKAALIQAISAVGLIGGAALASRYIKLHHVFSLLPLGSGLGAMVLTLPWSPSLTVATGQLLAVGVLSGMLIVPLNAVLQLRGYVLMSSGRSIAVQGFNENLAIITSVLSFSALQAMDTGIHALMVLLGLMLVVLFLAQTVAGRRHGLSARLNETPFSRQCLENVKKASST